MPVNEPRKDSSVGLHDILGGQVLDRAGEVSQPVLPPQLNGQGTVVKIVDKLLGCSGKLEDFLVVKVWVGRVAHHFGLVAIFQVHLVLAVHILLMIELKYQYFYRYHQNNSPVLRRSFLLLILNYCMSSVL